MPLTKEEITEAVLSANKETLKEFFVDRETHYSHHTFIGKVIDALDTIQSSAVRTITTFIVLGFLGLIALGFWMKLKS